MSRSIFSVTEKYFGRALVVVFVLWVIAPFIYHSTSTFYISPEESILINIPRGSTLKQVSFALRDDGIINNPYMFMILVALKGDESNLHAGTYRFEGELSLMAIADDISTGRVAVTHVTVPEGFGFSDIASLLEEVTGEREEDIESLKSDEGLREFLGLETGQIEGFLFPDTYLVPVDISPKEFLKVMIARYHEIFDDSFRERASELGYSEVEIVTLASIIEKETRIEDERRIISGVFHNRLSRGIPLEADPTIRYAIRKYSGHILYKDLEIDSPYNTYMYRGLPPSPICNPGKASLLAALYPEDVDYLYFVAAGDGTHIFSRTLAQHNRARKLVRKANSRGVS